MILKLMVKTVLPEHEQGIVLLKLTQRLIKTYSGEGNSVIKSTI
jgi:hypothetical protein